MGWLDRFKQHKGDVYRPGQALPEPEHETATGRKLYTVQQIRAAYAQGSKDSPKGKKMNSTYKPAVRPHLEWIGAPQKTEWGADMMEALIELSKDETARLYVSKSAIPLVDGALRALLGNQSTALVCAPGGPDTA